MPWQRVTKVALPVASLTEESRAMSDSAKFCRACGVDVSVNNKNRHPLLGKEICQTLTEFATDAVKAVSSSELLLDIQQFQAGYVCRACYRELVKLHTLKEQLKGTKECIRNKLAKIACLLPANPRNPGAVVSTATTNPTPHHETQSSYVSPQSSRKRRRTEQMSNTERRKRRRILETVQSAPTATSSTSSPDVVVSK